MSRIKRKASVSTEWIWFFFASLILMNMQDKWTLRAKEFYFNVVDATNEWTVGGA